jgi:hypothetical protein
VCVCVCLSAQAFAPAGFTRKDLSRIELQLRADAVLQTMGIKGLEPVDFETAQFFIVEVARSSPCAWPACRD